MLNNIVYTIVVFLASIIIILCSIGIIIASKFQRKQEKKYKEVNELIKKNKKTPFKVKDGLTKEEINKIDSKVDIDLLMQNLYSTYLELENKIKNKDDNLDNILTGTFKDFIKSKIENYKLRGLIDITDDIELINYSIMEFSKNKLKFRITINCLSYKLLDNKIVSGSDSIKKEIIIILSYEKINNKWLISLYDKIYEKLSE